MADTLPPQLVWLADAPLFIDADHVGRFYDAVARPETRQGAINLAFSEENVADIKGKLNFEGSLTTEKLAALLAPVFAFIKPSLSVAGEAGAEEHRKQAQSSSVELLPISTPQRELVKLALHYLINHTNRLLFVNPSEEHWRSPETIAQVPRAMAFLDLPGLGEAKSRGLAETKLIPTAAEFSNGKIVQIYKELKFTDDELPQYPERAASLDELKAQRKKYWQWFDTNYSATKAMLAVEEAASAASARINWIDYRLPISTEGDTLHLHLCPSGRYDTGVLAYNFIKRGYKHGIRLVGTLKSEPDMNVLAVYDK